jgi:hypothetical protein
MYRINKFTIAENKMEILVRLTDNAFIPRDPANTDYQQYLLWLKEGNTPEPAPEPPAPQELTVQEKLASAGITLDELKEALGL